VYRRRTPLSTVPAIRRLAPQNTSHKSGSVADSLDVEDYLYAECPKPYAILMKQSPQDRRAGRTSELEDGSHRHREPPKVTWHMDEQYDPMHKRSNAIVTAKGLIPVLEVGSPNEVNVVVPDIVEIGGIEDLRLRGEYSSALWMACLHADFQGKRILSLLLKDGSLARRELAILEKALGGRKPSVSKIVKLKLKVLVEVLFRLSLINPEEHRVLGEVRVLRNRTQHKIVAKYEIDGAKANENLNKVIQILLRLRELPPCLDEGNEITGYECSTFWKEIGHDLT